MGGPWAQTLAATVFTSIVAVLYKRWVEPSSEQKARMKEEDLAGPMPSEGEVRRP